MGIAKQLTEDMKSSMKSGEAVRTGVLRLLRGSLKNEEIKVGHALDEAEATRVLVREAKQRKDSIAAYVVAERNDLADIEKAELGIISGYLPEVMGEAELSGIIDDVVVKMGATDAKQMGAVIGAVMGRVGARSDGGTVARLVRDRLAS